MMSFNQQYAQMLVKLKHASQVSPRGMFTRELLYQKFEIYPSDRVIKIPMFETGVGYALIEYDWYLAATNRIDFHPRIQKTWAKFSDDGVHVNSAYGYRIFAGQWEWCLDTLAKDPESRQAVININASYDKGRATKDFPCTMYIHLFLRGNNLVWSTHMRSQDIYYGTRNDVFCFCKLQERFAADLSERAGKKIIPALYIHFMDSVHAYQNTLDKIDEETLREVACSEDAHL